MSVRPTRLHADGTIEIVHDDPGYGCVGVVDLADVKWERNPLTGADNRGWLVINCPGGCGSVSHHPAGGGAAPEIVQRLFVNKIRQAANGQLTFLQARALLRKVVEDQEGLERWRLENAQDTTDFVADSADHRGVHWLTPEEAQAAVQEYMTSTERGGSE